MTKLDCKEGYMPVYAHARTILKTSRLRRRNEGWLAWRGMSEACIQEEGEMGRWDYIYPMLYHYILVSYHHGLLVSCLRWVGMRDLVRMLSFALCSFSSSNRLVSCIASLCITFRLRNARWGAVVSSFRSSLSASSTAYSNVSILSISLPFNALYIPPTSHLYSQSDAPPLRDPFSALRRPCQYDHTIQSSLQGPSISVTRHYRTYMHSLP
ncbi:uncharacterized protein EI97DRAFT_248538 [Westerdykella ornata]|uniref:Uncharacterized protein n=1 Tax=Westerdykella ornata TaxID=318751 RepID=A0A6A6JNM0_WESOR|nr:uncharacterized protein EI97DRAFT_248538 [Westerdykella ornata]KAF2278230.1 hypothetical protein EI97DRAFT_248538 [Westerdykella ornata]